MTWCPGQVDEAPTTWLESRLFVEVTPWQEGILTSSRVTSNPKVIGSSAGLVPRNAHVYRPSFTSTKSRLSVEVILVLWCGGRREPSSPCCGFGLAKLPVAGELLFRLPKGM